MKSKPKVPYEHPRYPGLIVVKEKKNGNIKIKGMRRWRHPQYPFLMELSKAEDKSLAKGIEWLKRNEHKRFTDACLSTKERRQLSRDS